MRYTPSIRQSVKALSILSVLFFGASVVPAQADLPRLGVAAAHPVDVLGITIGMTPAEAVAALKAAFPRAKPKLNQRQHLYTKKRFVESIGLRLNQWPKQQIYLRFTGHWSGNRLYAIYRKVSYKRGDNPPFSETLANITRKYGAPSYAIGGGTRLNYAFNPQLLRTLPEDQIAASLKTRTSLGYSELSKAGDEATKQWRLVTRCMEAVPKVQNPQFFDILKARGNKTPGCSAGMDISLRRSGELLNSMEIQISDFQLLVDAIAIDRKLNQQNKPVPKATGSTSRL